MAVLRQGAGAYVRVVIRGKSYVFRVDTGAERTVISTHLAHSLGLPPRGPLLMARPIGCLVRVQPVEMSRWAIADMPLPTMTIASQANVLAGPRLDGLPISGLLGSDVLERFGTVTLNLPRQQLILRARLPHGGIALPMTVHHGRIGGRYETTPITLHGQTESWLLDTGAQATLVAATTASAAGLRHVAPAIRIRGASGCSALVQPVAVDHWTAASTTLPATTALSARSPSVRKFASTTIAGIVGADILASFKTATFDFQDGRLILGGVTTP